MMGMEKMLAGMLGITPEQMQATINGLMTAATTGVEEIQKISAQNTEILERLERLENGRP